mmetsp:Transcript_31998/g.82941  ORF Transcript_31998/g.82941 Transcript_31998/m.82941 type:complete len:88 (-) Transcript_31998:867-1130(-)
MRDFVTPAQPLQICPCVSLDTPNNDTSGRRQCAQPDAEWHITLAGHQVHTQHATGQLVTRPPRDWVTTLEGWVLKMSDETSDRHQEN